MTADASTPHTKPAARVARARASARSSGGRPPFGYRRDGARLVPDPETAPIRRLIYELFIEHKRLLGVARILHARGFRTATGKPFSRQTVLRNIRDTTAKGLCRTNSSRPAETGVSAERSSHAVPPIVPAELWEEANAILDARRTERVHIGRPATHLFSGFVRCACGGAMYMPTRTSRYRCRTCANGIPAADLEDVFLKELGELLREEWRNLSLKERRDIVELLTRTITVGPDTVSLDFRCVPDAPPTDPAIPSPFPHASARSASRNSATKGT